jgi:hypothetical protein
VIRARHASGAELTFETPATTQGLPEPGDTATLHLRPDAINLLPDPE